MAKVKISELPSLSPATLDTTYVVGISGSTTYKISINQLTSSLDTTFATDLVTAALSSSLNGKLSTSSYSNDSSSFDNRIKNSQPIGYLTTASYTTDSSSFNSRIISGSAVAGTISSSAQISGLGFITASTPTDLSSLNTISASYLLFTQSYYSASASFDSRVDSLENATSSYLTSLNGAISGAGQISDLGFVTGSYTTINSFNSLTQSFNSISQSFNVISGSVGTVDFSTLATTGSNIFIGGQTISGSLLINSKDVVFTNRLYVTASSSIGIPASNDALISVGGTQGDIQLWPAFFSINYRTGLNNEAKSGFNYERLYFSSSVGQHKLEHIDGNFDIDTNIIISGSLNVSGSITGSTNFNTIVNKPTLISSSAQVLVSSGIFSSSAQLPVGLVSGSFQVLNGSGIFSSSAQLPTGIISSSAQLENATITNLTITNLTTVNETSSIIYSSGSNQLGDALNDTQILSGSIKLVGTGSLNGYTILTSNDTASFLTTLNGAISSSAQVLNGSGIFSSSAQLPTGLISSSTQLPSNLISGSSQISTLGFITGSYVSSSTYTTDSSSFNSRIISGSAVAGTISSSAQISALGYITSSQNVNTSSLVTTSSFNSFTASQYISNSYFATTGSNSFNGNQNITGSLIVSAVAVVNGGITLPTGSILSLTSGSSLFVDVSGSITGSLTGSVFGIGDVVVFSSSVDSRIKSGSAVAGTISSSAQISALGYATTSSVTTISASAWGAFQSASSYSSSLATSISASNYNITINSASVSSISSSFATSTSASNASITALSSSNATTDNTQTTNITAASASAWGAFQSASSYSSSVSTSLSLVSASLQSSISASNYNITINSASVSSLSSSFNTRVSANSASAWGAFQTASANSSSLATSITSVSGTFTNLTVNGQPTTYGVVNPNFINAGRITSDQTSAGNGSDIIFNSSIVSSGISLNTSTGVFTLTAGKTYKLFAELSFSNFSSIDNFIIYNWVDATTNTRLDTSGVSAGVGEAINRNVSEFNATSTTLIYTPTTNQTVKVRIVDANGTATIRADIGTKAIIEQINPTIAVQSTATGTVAATIVTDTNPVTTTINAGSSTSPGLTILTLAIPSAGTWRLDAELRVYVPGAGYMAAAFYDNGTLIPGSEYFVAAGGVTQSGAATGQYSGFMSYDLTTTSARTVTVGIWSTTSANAIASEDGRTWARATKIDSTFALNTLNTMQISGSLTTTGSITSLGGITGSIAATNGVISGSSQLTTAFPSKTTGTWSVPNGASTQSFSVETGASYTMWVNGNIPNGIITWNATVTTSNTNVPVVGSQHGWYYSVGNALVLTSMPDQITGTNGSIVNTPTSYAPNTSNVFKFGITNNSGTTQTINYGYIKLS